MKITDATGNPEMRGVAIAEREWSESNEMISSGGLT